MQSIEWVNDGPGSSNRVNLNGFEDEKEMNELLKTTKTCLRKISEQKGINTGVGNLSHAEDILVKGKSEKMFQEHRRVIATEQPKFKMILGITNMGKRQHWKRGAKNPEVVKSIDKDKWRDALMDDVTAASQQKQCWETRQKLSRTSMQRKTK